MWKNPFKSLLVACMLVAAFTPAGAAELDAFKGEKGTLKISGGTAHIPVMKEAAQLIMARYPDIQISIAAGGSGVGIKQVGEGLVDIGNSGRKPTDEEIARYGLKVHQWALDGVGIVVNPKNRVRALSKVQVMDIFAGRIENWKALGGEDRKINIYARDEASGTREVFWEKALNKGMVVGGANIVASNGAMKSAVAQDPYGIGYVSVGHIDQSVAPVIYEGVVPTTATVKGGKYTISRGLYSNTKGEPSGLAKKFIEFLFTPQGRKLIEKHGFIPYP
ncbi:MAG TPA: phosphate ABC transporter substrate-binding protein [Deltaproteobacteria bacterium]|nr:phosphate ABC transporter substrate-binding protein [Deltaproteobacteria bacterium]